MKRENVIIMGAAGRDFHNFNVYFRNNPLYNVVCFTATQIPNIDGRRYPPELSGRYYKKGIPIFNESDLPVLIKKLKADQVVFAYSDVRHTDVMHKASIVLSCGADFRFLGPKNTMLISKRPVIAVTAVRTGCGKSQTTRKVANIIREMGKKVVVVRHPMPYGDLKKQACQRFKTYKDLETHNCTIEEREEYEPLIDNGITVFAGVDYERILREAEKEADVIIWDGGNNDMPFFMPDLHITLTDPHRPGHETEYHPGEANLRMADVILINKSSTAKKDNIETVRKNIHNYNPRAVVIQTDSVITTDTPHILEGKKALVVEDGPTLTHGGMSYGAGTIAAMRYNAKIIDPRPFAVGSIKNIFTQYSHLGSVLPAMGYSKSQIKEIEKTINRSNCDVVIAGTPIDLNRVLKSNKPILRIRYELDINTKPSLEDIIKKTLKGR